MGNVHGDPLEGVLPGEVRWRDSRSRVSLEGYRKQEMLSRSQWRRERWNGLVLEWEEKGGYGGYGLNQCIDLNRTLVILAGGCQRRLCPSSPIPYGCRGQPQ